MNNRIFIIGGGPSLKGFNFKKFTNKDTIATNEAIFDIRTSNYFMTIDYSWVDRMTKKKKDLLFNQCKSTKIFVANCATGRLKEIDGTITDTKIGLKYNMLDRFDKVIKSNRKDGLGKSFNDFRTGDNSGYCAMQLALILGYKKIYLCGIDLNDSKDTHYHNRYKVNSKKFSRFMDNFRGYFKDAVINYKSVFPNTEIISCSKNGYLNKFIKYQDINSVV